ncbi:MAG: DUF3343 domain-containing protein [Oscillospiraceae bacterium]|jgi:hypothetical protein|nr:DUF3343 domain-containing protein [Oscillospiraceae bacterium]
MSGCLIACRSLTYAQRSARALENAGFTATVLRMPAALSDSGCGHAVKIPERMLAESVALLRDHGLLPKKAYVLTEDGLYAELPL